MHRRFQGRLIVAVVGVLAAGCGGTSDGLKREPVSGRVTLDGQAVGKGEITFAPTGGGGLPSRRPSSRTAVTRWNVPTVQSLGRSSSGSGPSSRPGRNSRVTWIPARSSRSPAK